MSSIISEVVLDMKPESRVRDYFEIAGILSLIASLLFVGWQLKLTQDMNIAQLHYNRLSLYQDRFTAILESEILLRMNSKRFNGTWNEGDLTPL